MIAGGIDPETGYSRRVMNVFHNIDFSSPYKNIDLVNFDNFIAGEVSLTKDIKNLDMIQEQISGNPKTMIIIFIIFLIIILISLVIIIKYIRK